jgi:hypothetical protein
VLEGTRGVAEADVEVEAEDTWEDELLELELSFLVLDVVGSGVQVVVGSGLGVVVGLGFQVKVGLGIHSLVVFGGCGGGGAPSLKYQVP